MENNNSIGPSIIGTWINVVAQTYESYGYDKSELLQSAGIDAKDITNPDARIPIKKYSHLWDLVVSKTKDPCVGLTVLPHIRPTTFHALGIALMASSTIKKAMERLLQFYQIISDEVDVRINEYKNVTELCFSPVANQPLPAAASVDAFMAVTITYARILDKESLVPISVSFMHDKPKHIGQFEKMFKAPVIFSAENNRIVFDNQVILKPLPTANSEIALRNDQLAINYLSRFKKDRFDYQVHAKIIELLSLEEPSLEKIANSIGVSTRSLNRYLSQHKTSYRDILKEIRKQLAVQYLKQRDFSIIDVAFRLGYSDSSNFTRAFKQWFGVTPSEYRSVKFF